MSTLINPGLLEAVRNYQTPPDAIEILTKHKPLVLAGVTAAGKDTVASYLIQNGDFQRVITNTTRPPRDNDQHGKDYWFVSEDQMLALLHGNEMVETQVLHNQAVSGVSIKSYQSAVAGGRRPILVIDVHGAEQISKHVPGLQAVFLLPPSFEVWMERLDKRGPMSHVERKRRLQSAQSEIQHALSSKYFNLFVNQDVNTTAQAIITNVHSSPEQQHNRDLAQRLLDHIRAY